MVLSIVENFLIKNLGRIISGKKYFDVNISYISFTVKSKTLNKKLKPYHVRSTFYFKLNKKEIILEIELFFWYGFNGRLVKHSYSLPKNMEEKVFNKFLQYLKTIDKNKHKITNKLINGYITNNLL